MVCRIQRGRHFLELKCVFLRFSQKRHDVSAPNFFQDLGENTCPLQPALKSIAPGLLRWKKQAHKDSLARVHCFSMQVVINKCFY